jgi:hypothetical protein
MFTNHKRYEMRKLVQTIQFLLIGGVAFAQPVLQWENRFDFEGGFESPAYMKIGTEGDIYISGISNVGTFEKDIISLKISSDGTTEWSNLIRNDYDDGSSGLVVDNEGNCYVGGYLGDIFLDEAGFVVKYLNNGSQSWIDTPANSTPLLAIDTDNNVHALLSGDNIHLIKYNSLGDYLLDVKNDTSYSGHNYNSKLFVVDQGMNMYVAGEYYDAIADNEIFLKKFSSEGNLLVDIKYNPTGEEINPILMKVDLAGNIYLAGSFGLFYKGIFLAKFDSDGGLLWDNFIFDESGIPYDLILDPSQNPVICGKVYEVNQVTEYIIIKYDQDGNEVWKDYPGKATPSFTKVAHLASDQSGNVYFLGSVWPVAITEPSFQMFKYDVNGIKLWEYKKDSILSDLNDFVTNMAFDTENNLIVTLQAKGLNGNKDILTQKYGQLTGIEESTSKDNSMRVIPNPFHSIANVSFSNTISDEGNVTLLDLSGREIISASFHQNYQIDRKGIPNGMYLLKVVSEDGITSTAKVIIY